LPEVFHTDGKVSYVDPARAVTDTVRTMADLSDVRALVAAGVQRGKVAVWQLASELERGPVQGSARLRRALAEVSDGARSAAEADLLTLIRQSKLPEPLYNPRLYVGKVFLASPDAWWPGSGLAVEVDSRAWHLSPADWERTLARHARMTAEGILVLHFPPGRLRKDRRAVVSEMRSALSRSQGPLPHIRTVPGARVA
jgi:very-short-patch-repair endonuclease